MKSKTEKALAPENSAGGKQSKGKAGKPIKQAAGPKPKKGAKGKGTAKGADPRIKPIVRAGSKSEAVLELLRRKEGATLAELATATGWQNHSIRGFLSGTVKKKMGLTVTASKPEGGERTYSIVN